MAIPLPHFLLDEPIGRGGMGVVWGGHHLRTGEPVAIKVLTAPDARLQDYLAGFASEIRSAAAFDHPHITAVFDHGAIDATAAEASGGELVEGAPYLVMERASGSLRDKRPRTWAEVRALLLGMLDALGHAHAAGVVHRDLKPGNVLRFTDGASTTHKLADFGIAHRLLSAHPQHSHSDSSMGTPAFMAPEQVRGQWRDQGPWTDLYALGCLAWTLCTGSPPFLNPSIPRLLRDQLYAPLPAFEPAVHLPDGVRPWLVRLLQKDPADRFRRAADAAHALRLLPEPSGDAPLADWEVATTAAQTALVTWATTRFAVPDEAATTRLTPSPKLVPIEVPPLPELPPPPRGRPRPPLPGTGLGLVGLRAARLVGRDAEQRNLWTALSEVIIHRQPRVAVLSGEAGVGKTRLAEWLIRRAAELGAARGLRSLHGSAGGNTPGTAGMLERVLRTQGLPREEALARTERVLRGQRVTDRSEWEGLLRVHRPDGIGFARANERNALVARFMVRAAEDRAVVWLVDEAHLSPEDVDLVAHVLARPSPTPILAILTVEGSLSTSLATLATHPRASHLHMQAMDDPDIYALLRRLLGLAPELSVRVQAHARGNPRYAIDLVGEWVQRGALVPTEDGFVLAAGHEAIPSNLAAMWSQRIDALLSPRPPQDRIGLERAAALGGSLSPSVWHAHAPDVDHGRLVAALAARGMADTRRDSPSLYPPVRDALEQGARAAGRWQAHHGHIADHIARSGGVAEAIGRHLADAGRHEEAIAPLLAGARAALRSGRLPHARALVARHEGALRALGNDMDPRWADGWEIVGDVHRVRGDLTEAEACAVRTAKIAAERGWARAEWRALSDQASIALMQARIDEARDLFKRARALAEAAGDDAEVMEIDGAVAEMLRVVGDTDAGIALIETLLPRSALAHKRARALWHLIAADLYRQAGQIHRAEVLYLGQLKILEDLGIPRHGAKAMRGLGDVMQDLGRLEEATEWILRARRTYERCANPLGAADCTNDLAEVHRLRGDLDAAEAGYREAAARYAVHGSAEVTIPRANLGMVLVARERYAEARDVLEDCAARFEEQGRTGFAAAMSASLLVCVVDDVDAWMHHAARAREGLSGFADGDVYRALAKAGTRATELGHAGRAREAWTLALDQAQRLGRRDWITAATEGLGTESTL